jgi:hypothetical protein
METQGLSSISYIFCVLEFFNLQMCEAGVDPNSIVAGGSAAGYAEETSFSQAFLGRITRSQS